MIDAAALLRAMAAELQRDPGLRDELRGLLTPTQPTQAAVLFLTPTGFAARLGVSRRLVFNWLADGMPSLGSGKARRIPVAAGEAWLAERATSSNRDVETAAKAAALRVVGSTR